MVYPAALGGATRWGGILMALHLTKSTDGQTEMTNRCWRSANALGASFRTTVTTWSKHLQ